MIFPIRNIFRIAAVLLVLYLVVFFILHIALDRSLYQPKSGFDESLLQRYALESVFIPLQNGTSIHGVYHQASTDVVNLFLHGNSGNITVNEPNIKYLNDAGVSYLMIDYPGYGLSSGRPSEQVLYASARTAYNYLIEQRNWRPEQLVINGQSLGGAVAIELASRVPAKSLIVESSFTSVRELARYLYPWIPLSWFVGERFSSLEKLSKVTVPTLFLHGERDTMIPLSMSEKLFGSAHEPKYLIVLPDLGHNDVIEYVTKGDEVKKINEFLFTGRIQ